MSDFHFGSKYSFCDGCPYRSEVDKAISCPARFSPYDADNCPRNAKFLEMEERARIGKEKKSRYR